MLKELKRASSRAVTKIPPTQLVDRSYSAYKRDCGSLRNPTNAVGGLFILGLRERPPLTHPNPTNAVGGLHLIALCVIDFFSADSFGVQPLNCKLRACA